MEKLPSMVDMALGEEDYTGGVMLVDSPKPKYPYGLCINLSKNELEKLGLDDSCEIGDMLHMFCMATVTSISKHQSANGEDCCNISLQITHISAEDEDEENGEYEEQETIGYGR